MAFSNQRLEGKTIVITGASSGIGRSTAFAFARAAPHNLKLVLTARRIDALRLIADEIAREVGDGVKVHVVQLDVSQQQDVKAFVHNLPADFQDIHVLVNNAGMAKGMDCAPDIPTDHVDAMIATNLNGLIYMTQAILHVFKKRPNGGSGDIINVGSIARNDPYPGGSVYCATKAAVHSFCQSIRLELIPTRIRVMQIVPGMVETEFALNRFSGDEAEAAKVYDGWGPLIPDDIAEVIVFNASRRETVVVADTTILPLHQAGTTAKHRPT